MGRRGRFITLEGGEGAGKSTQARLLAEWLRGQGRDVVLTREPGGTPGAEAIRSLVLSGASDRFSPEAEALLFAAARADHVHRLIRPALESGRWVVCDRFLDSSLAYQGGGNGLGIDAVRQANAYAVDKLLPDLTLMLLLPGEQARKRAATRDAGQADRIGGRDSAYHCRVAEAFDRIAKDEPKRIVTIDASDGIDAVALRVRQAVDERLSCP